MQRLSDVELIGIAQAGQPEAVGELYDRHQNAIYRYIRARIYDDELAHDLTGDVFLRMVAHIDSFEVRQGVPFSAWLYRIARNLLATHIVRQQQLKIVPFQQESTTQLVMPNLAVMVEKKLDLVAVTAAMEQLEESQREVVTLRFLVGLSLSDVAEIVDKSVGAVKSIQHRGLKSLHYLLTT